MTQWKKFKTFVRIGKGVIVDRRRAPLARVVGWCAYVLLFIPIAVLVFPLISKRVKIKDSGTSEYLYPMF